MDPSMLLVNVGPHEFLATELTLEWFVPTMDDSMLPQVTAQCEALSTLCALVRFLV